MKTFKQHFTAVNKCCTIVLVEGGSSCQSEGVILKCDCLNYVYGSEQDFRQWYCRRNVVKNRCKHSRL